jgi:hypothetical protein
VTYVIRLNVRDIIFECSAYCFIEQSASIVEHSTMTGNPKLGKPNTLLKLIKAYLTIISPSIIANHFSQNVFYARLSV